MDNTTNTLSTTEMSASEDAELLHDELSSVFQSKMSSLASGSTSTRNDASTMTGLASSEQVSDESVRSESRDESSCSVDEASVEETPQQQQEEEVETCDSAIPSEIGTSDSAATTNDTATTPVLDIQTLRKLQQQQALQESAEEVLEEEEVPNPLKLLRKGAVAAVGGTMVGLGLIMIPLPTPFGAVVASSGMAVLGTEFESAREMNEKIIDKTKTHLETAREHVIRSIESMDEDIEDKNSPATKQDSTNGENKESEDAENSEEGKDVTKDAAVSNQVKANGGVGKMYDQWKKQTKTYLNRNLVPFLKKTRQTTSKPDDVSSVVSVPDAEATVQSEVENMSQDGDFRGISDLDDETLDDTSLRGRKVEVTNGP